MSALTDFFTSLANKVRAKLGTSTTYTPAQAVAAIDDVYTKGVTDTKKGDAVAGNVVKGKTFTSNSAGVNVTGTFEAQTKSAASSASAQTITPDSGKYLSSVSISAISPQRSAGTSATLTGLDNTGPYVYFPYGWWPQAHATYGNFARMTAAQAVTACPKQEKTITSSRSAQTVTPDSGKLLSKVTVNALAPSGTYSASSRGSALDMGATSNYRYVNTNSVPNTNSATYTPSAHGTALDMGSTNTYRYVNTTNVYNQGYNNCVKTEVLSSVQLAGTSSYQYSGTALGLYICIAVASAGSITNLTITMKSGTGTVGSSTFPAGGTLANGTRCATRGVNITALSGGAFTFVVAATPSTNVVALRIFRIGNG